VNVPVPLKEAAPPDPVTVTAVVPPWQSIAEPGAAETIIAIGWLIVTVVVAEQPLPSVTV
jgi:hypothetical protein